MKKLWEKKFKDRKSEIAMHSWGSNRCENGDYENWNEMQQLGEIQSAILIVIQQQDDNSSDTSVVKAKQEVHRIKSKKWVQ